MENVNKKKEISKTQGFNVIILDRSGSMESIRQAAVEGFNETLAGIKKAQKKFADTQKHFVSLATFCSCGTENVYDKTPVDEVQPLKASDYEPCCRTPLYDAMGITIKAIYKHVKDIEDAVVVVTVITDGMENASKEYSRHDIKGLVERLRNEGWTFTYMGANQNSIEIAASISIRNASNFEFSDRGIVNTMTKDSATRMNFFARLPKMKENESADGCNDTMTAEIRRRIYTGMADDAFDEENGK